MEATLLAWERDIATWLNPELPYDARATKGWWMTSMPEFLVAIGVYTVIVVVGLVLRAAAGGRDRDDGSWNKKKAYKAGDKAVVKGTEWVCAVDCKGAAPTSRPKAGATVYWTKSAVQPSVWSSFVKEPIKFMQVPYNAFQVALCGYMSYTAARIAYEDKYSLVCNKFDGASTRMAEIEYIFYLSKILDFLDTFFMIVRGKWSQMSFLHVFHHFSIFSIYYLVTVMGYDGDIYYTVVANSFIHFVMYFYYLCTCFKYYPSWGQQLTQMQMVQFVTMIAQGLYLIINQGSCAYPTRILYFYVAYIAYLLALFASFYVQKWVKGDKVATAATAEEDKKKA